MAGDAEWVERTGHLTDPVATHPPSPRRAQGFGPGSGRGLHVQPARLAAVQRTVVLERPAIEPVGDRLDAQQRLATLEFNFDLWVSNGFQN